MTIEQLVGMSADEWERLTDEELIKILTPFFHVTKPDPEKLKEHTTTMTKAQEKKQIQKEYDSALRLARQLGLQV